MAANEATRANKTSIKIPGRVSPGDKSIIAGAYNLLCRQQSAGRTSLLRVVDSLDSRYRFQISNPRDVDTNALRSLELKLQRCRSVTLDLPRNRIIVECWRDSHVTEKRGKKRGRRDLEDVKELPEHIEAELLPLMPSGSSVLFVGSTLSEKAVKGAFSYVVSKHAQLGMMRATCQDLMGRGIHTALV